MTSIYVDNWTSRNLVCSECGYPTLHRCEECDEGLCVECSDRLDRTSDCYPVTEDDIRALGQAEFLMNVFLAAASLFAGAAISIWTTIETVADPLPAKAMVLRNDGFPVCVGLAVFFVFLFVFVNTNKETLLDHIRKESGVDPSAVKNPATLGDLLHAIRTRATFKRSGGS